MVATYSGGMRRPLDLAMTLVGNPGMIFLDEPTTGLDPRSRRTMWEITRELVSTGVTIFSLRRTGRRPTSSPTGSRPRLGPFGCGRHTRGAQRRIPGGHARLHFRDLESFDSAAGILSRSSRSPTPAEAGAVQAVRNGLAAIRRSGRARVTSALGKFVPAS
jgi:ABC-2 type transport system ATP-binding protein